jgi:hypothetical protein
VRGYYCANRTLFASQRSHLLYRLLFACRTANAVKILRRILIGIGISVALVAIFVFWGFPVGMSIWTVWKAPIRAKVVPTELANFSISQAAGSKLDYFGYEFEVPWTDIAESKKLNSNHVLVNFHSGLQVSVTVLPTKEFVDGVAVSFGVSPEVFESKIGYEAAHSDYEFLRRLYALTPDKMNIWAASPSVHYRDIIFLRIKYGSLMPWADSGIFSVANQSYKGFQQGNPDSRPNGILVNLYADDGSVEFEFNQENYQNPMGISQSEINRVIQSLHESR